MTRAFYQWSGGTPQDHEALAWFSGATPEHMGPRVAGFHGCLTARAWASSLALCAVVVVTLGLLVALLSPEGPSVGLLLGVACTVGGIFFAIMVLVWALARATRQDVHQHGLVVRGAWGRREAIPWATIDPGRIFISKTVRSMTRMPLALHRQQAVLPPGVVVNGWTDRPLGSFPGLEAFSQGYRYQPAPSETPFGWWQLGTTDPETFLRAVEAAMVADGYPAAGLTPFVLARRVTATDLRRAPELQRERMLTDPVLGLPRG